MKTEFYINVINMLRSQLTEEEEEYRNALKKENPLWKIKEIQQRIKSLRESLFSLKRSQQLFN